MSSTSRSLVQSSSANSLTRTTSGNSSSASPLAITTSSLPTLNLTPLKNSTLAKPLPSTPQLQASPAPSTSGGWQHPRMTEIIRRQNASNFDSSNVRTIVLSLGLLLGSLGAPQYITPYLPAALIDLSEPYASYSVYAVLAFLTLNIAVALAPAFRTQDACEDVPLTPHQRSLLGLPPMSRPATPQEQAQYVTPPRYSRSTTPASGASSASSFPDSLRVNARGSPLSSRNSPLDSSVLDSTVRFSSPGSAQRGSGGSPAYAGSPLAGRMLDGRRRSSFGSGRSSPLGDGDSVGGTPVGKSNRASVGLNSKWLYEKGRGSSQLMGNGWGTGSVFN